MLPKCAVQNEHFNTQIPVQLINLVVALWDENDFMKPDHIRVIIKYKSFENVSILTWEFISS